ncbi:uncharacterized protein LOC135701011 [Ochlerotatus camptorhynchus]|uniref:uncharacterized protein LOC135701011 n=1 Tax=Ochlerotatus camptorhynchus TaxID=644619 RepID=UPI0031DBB7F0
MNRKPDRNKQDVEEGDEWDGFCRLCFSEANGMVQLFPEDNSPDRDLLWKILECTTLKLTFDTDHTARICLECIQCMTDFCDYRMQCLRNDKRISTRRQRKRTYSHIQKHPEELNVLEQPEVDSPEEFRADPLDEYEDCHEDSVDDVEEDDHLQPNANPSSIKEELTIEDDHLMNTVVENDSVDTDEATDQPEKVKKKRIRKVLLHDGHTYQLLSSRPKCDSITWGCIWRKSKACKGTIGTRASGLILGNVIPQHNHPPQPVESKQRKAVIIHAYREVENIYLDEPYEITRNRIGADMLMYNGDRYPYSHSRKDGCRIWKCSSHRNCKVSIYLCPDGRIFKLANSQHSDVKIQQKRSRTMDNEATVSDISSNIEDIYPEPVGTFNYKIVKNANKRNVLIYGGDRYTFYYKKTNGWVVWRCTVSKGCLAMIYQLRDDSVVVLGDTTHNHLKTTDSS